MARVAPLNTIEGHIEVPELKPGPGPGPRLLTMPNEKTLTSSRRQKGWKSKMIKIIPYRVRSFAEGLLYTARTLADGSAFELWLEEFKEENYTPKALSFFSIEKRSRKHLIFTVEHLWFDNIVVLLICINCVFIATTDPRSSASDPWVQVLDRVEKTFTILFVFEMILKILAFGFFKGEKTYLSDPWNSMDCIIVVSGVFTIIQGSQNLASIRLFRILRPLRLLTNIEGLRVLVMGFARAIPLLLNALFLLIFLCLMFGLFGVQLFSGKLEYQCIKEWADVLYQEEGEFFEIGDLTHFSPSTSSFAYLDTLEIYRINREQPFNFRLMWDDDIKKTNVWSQLNNPMDRSSNVTGFEFEHGALAYPYSFHGLRPSENPSVSLMVGSKADGSAGEAFIVGQHLKSSTGKLIGPALNNITTISTRTVRLQANTSALELTCSAISNQTECQLTGVCRWVHQGQFCGGARYEKAGTEPSKQNRCHKTCKEEGYSCLKGERPNFGHTCFANLLWGFAVIYQCITMEGWSEIMILSWDATGSAIVPVYFLVLIFVGSFFVINLTLVAIKAKLFNTGQTPEVQIQKYSETLYKKIKANRKKGKCKRLQMACFKMISHPWFNRIFMTLIIINTGILAYEKHGMEMKTRKALGVANLILTILFGIEMVIKIAGLSLKAYCKDTFNLFDGVIAIVSIVEICISSGTVLSSSRIVRLVRLLRMFRVLRVVKLVRYLETLQRLLWVISCSVRSIGYIYLLLALFMLIFAILGVQLFAGRFVFNESLPYIRSQPYWKSYYPDVPFYTPRSNFDTLPNAFITVFQILTLEDWDVIMFDGMRGLSPMAILYFMMWTMIGVYFLLNMVLAIVLQKFEEDQKIQLEKRLQEQRLAAAIKQHRTLTKNCLKNNTNDVIHLDTMKSMEKMNRPASWRLFCACRRDLSEKVRQEREMQLVGRIQAKIKRCRSKSILEKLDVTGKHREWMKKKKKQKSVKAWSNLKMYVNNDRSRLKKSVHEAIKVMKVPFCPDKALGKDEGNEDFSTFRDANGSLTLPQACDFNVIGVTDHMFYNNCIHNRLSKLVTSDSFQKFIMLLIILSSITLVFEAPSNSPQTVTVLRILDSVFTFIFFAEMLVNIFVMGLVGMPESYLSNPWNVLDFVIVSASTINLLMNVEDRSSVIRLLLAFRPLRLLSRSEGMRVVIFALFHSLPAIINVLWVIILVWTIFAILGVQIFSGRFWCCDLVPSKFMDAPGENDAERCKAAGGIWDTHVYNFDNIFNAMLALFVVSSLESWPMVMYCAMDITEPYTNPEKEASMLSAVYFIIFIIFSTFFLISLLVGVVFDNFVKLRDEQMGIGFLTCQQKNWVQSQLMVADASPLTIPLPPGTTEKSFVETSKANAQNVKAIAGPEHCRMPFYRIASNPAFEKVIILCIVLNVLVMCLFHEGIDPNFLRGIEIANSTFTIIYVIEMLIKLLAFGVKGYFMNNWNRFDFLICCGAVIDEILDLIKYEVPDFFDPTLLRVFRVSRLVRLVKSADRLKTLLRTLILSLPSVANVVTLLFLMYFVFAVLGVNLFANIDLEHEPLEILDNRINFSNFPSALLTLFIVSTGDKWTEIMEDAGNAAAGGMPSVNKLYFVLFYIVVNFITLNLFIAIILDNFTIVSNSEKERDDVDNNEGTLGNQKLTEDMVQQFTEAWSQFDPTATRLIPYQSMLPLLQAVDPPLGLGPHARMTDLLKHTRDMMIPIHEANYVHFGELLYALSENICGANLPDKTRIAQKITRKLKKKLPMWGQPLQISFGVWLAVIKAQQIWKRIIARRKMMVIVQQRSLERRHSRMKLLSRYKSCESLTSKSLSEIPIQRLESPSRPGLENASRTSNESVLQTAEQRSLDTKSRSTKQSNPNKFASQARVIEPKSAAGITESSPGLIKCSIIPDGPPQSFENRPACIPAKKVETSSDCGFLECSPRTIVKHDKASTSSSSADHSSEVNIDAQTHFVTRDSETFETESDHD